LIRSTFSMGSTLSHGGHDADAGIAAIDSGEAVTSRITGVEGGGMMTAIGARSGAGGGSAGGWGAGVQIGSGAAWRFSGDPFRRGNSSWAMMKSRAQWGHLA